MTNCDTGSMRQVLRAVAIAAIGFMLAAAGQGAEQNCVPWKEAADTIAKNSLLPANTIYQMVQSRMGGQIIHASLCNDNGRFFYKLVVLGTKGDVSNVTVDALTGQP
jgi:uncharacterized membrane protein YkoI